MSRLSATITVSAVVIIVALLVTAKLALAQEALVTLQSTVTGNREQPKVMYIVPWQPPDATEFKYSLGGSLAQDLFREVDRDEFVRELKYRELLAQPTVNTHNYTDQ